MTSRLFLLSSLFLFVGLGFFCDAGILSATPPKRKRAKRAKLEAIEGRVHFYGDRYILKGVAGHEGKWFILLENSVLENLVKKLDSRIVYLAHGQLYKFNRNNYLLLTKYQKQSEKKVEKSKKKAKKSKKRSRKKRRKTKKQG